MSKAVAFGDAAVAEEKFGSVLAVPPHLFYLLPLFKTRRALFHHIQINGLIRIFDRRISNSQDKKSAVKPVTDEGFLAIDNVFVSTEFRSRRDRCQVGPGIDENQ